MASTTHPDLEVENHKLRVRIEELERMIDWKLDVVAGNAWIVRIEGDFTAIDDLLGDAVGHKIQSYEIANPHHEESHDPANPT
jgi:hypothetical protein